MTVDLGALDEGTGILVDDRIERRQCRLYTETAVEPVVIDRDRLDLPVDSTVSIRTTEVTLSQQSSTFVRGPDGQIVSKIEPFTEQHFEEGRYTVDVTGPIKIFLQVEAPMTVSADAVQVTVSPDGERDILVGARSFHEHPAATITTTDDPVDVLDALSYLGSALKTTAPERSYPTTRGHPPALEVGKGLSIPEQLDRPETGTRIVVPPTLDAAFVAAPLAYYLGATLEPGPDPRIVTDTGFEHPLGGPDGLEATVERALKRTFLLDCVTREDNAEALTLYEREALEARTDLDFPRLYGMAPTERLERYLDVPYELIEPHVPRWKLTAHVAPVTDSIEVLPFLVDDLAVVRISDGPDVTESGSQSAAIGEFVRSPSVRSPNGPGSGSGTGTGTGTGSGSGSGSGSASAAGTTTGSGTVSTGVGTTTEESSTVSLVQPEQTNSIEQVWVGEELPVGASKAVVEAYWNRLDREERNEDIEVVVVCNDTDMLDERDTVLDAYGSREDIPFDVSIYDDLTTDRLQFVLESDVDFLHYVGHIDGTGFECVDGMLDVANLGTVGLDAFMLNACQSYTQGIELIRRGGIGGVVTMDEVINSGAIRVGETMARLLNAGFPLRAALTIASDRSIVGGQYLVVGDGNVDLAHAESMAPLLCEIETTGDRFTVQLHAYSTSHTKMGGIIQPTISQKDRFFLIPGETTTFQVSREELLTFLELEEMPVRIDGEFTWSNCINTESI